MHLACKCLNVIIIAKGSLIEKYDLSKGISLLDHPFFKENIGCVELESIHKEQSLLVEMETCGDWMIHRCLNCKLFTHALDTASTAIVLVNRALLSKPQEIAALKNSEKYSPAFHIVVESDETVAPPHEIGGRGVGVGLQQQFTEWLKRETAETEERVRQFSEQQYSALELKRSRAHRDHATLKRILSSVKQPEINRPVAQFGNSGSTKASFSPSVPIPTPVLADPAAAIGTPRKPTQVANRPKNVGRKPSVDAEGLFDLEGMDDIPDPDTLPSDEELTDTDESGSHDEGIHIPRHMNVSAASMYAKSLPVNVPVFPHQVGSVDDPHHEYRTTKEQIDIAASIKALAKSVHGDTVFGDLPRPRFSSQI